jgi:hypothetical protein
MPIEISVRSNIKEVSRKLGIFAQKQINYATARSLNDCIQDCRQAVPNAMRQVFRDPVPRTLNALRYKPATKSTLTATLWINDDGGKGIAPAKYLAAEVQGGARHQKRFERALQMRGLMPAGMFAIPAESAPRNANGDVPGSFYVRILSYLAAFGEQGYRANMTDKNRARIAGIKVNARGFKTITGAMYFVSLGRGKAKHLKPGIYKKSGTHGVDVEPVFYYVSAATYKPRLDFEGVVLKTFGSNFTPHMTKRLAEAAATAR